MVIPEIAKFENKMLKDQKTIDSFELMLSNFDEIIQLKANKMTVQEQFNKLSNKLQSIILQVQGWKIIIITILQSKKFSEDKFEFVFQFALK